MISPNEGAAGVLPLRESNSNKRARHEAEPKVQHYCDFPFPPYAQQEALMTSLYSCLDDGGVGIFESPTGTGKSLSLLCATLRWLHDQEAKEEAKLRASGATSSDAEPAWVEEQTLHRKAVAHRAGRPGIAEARRLRALRLSSVAASAATVAAAISAADEAAATAGVPASAARGSGAQRGGKVARRGHGAPPSDLSALAAVVEGAEDAVAGDDFALADVNDEGVSMEQELALAALDDDDDDAADKPPKRQVFFCSRTHSQLAQIVGEVQKTGYATSIAVASLGSRSTLCLHEPVRSKPAERINDACLDLQQAASKAKAKAKAKAEGAAKAEAEARALAAGGKAGGAGGGGKRTAAAAKAPKASGCPYLHAAPKRGGAEQYGASARMRDEVLQTPHDIEQLRALGREQGHCPYYAARSAVGEAELVLLPYAALLHTPTRESLGISLASSVVVVDEAHNLIDTINEMHSVAVSSRQLSEAGAQLAQYAERYHARLKHTNRMFVQQLLYVVRKLRTALAPPEGPGQQPEEIRGLNTFLSSLNIDNINLFRLRAFCHASELAKKLHGFVESEGVRAHAQAAYSRAALQRAAVAGPAADDATASPANSMHCVLALLEALTNHDRDGRVLVQREARGAPSCTPAASGAADGAVRVLHLNPAVYFARVLDEAHAIVLAGGTMQPFADLEQQLLHSLPAGRLRAASFDHIVPAENVLPLAVGTGRRGESKRGRLGRPRPGRPASAMC